MSNGLLGLSRLGCGLLRVEVGLHLVTYYLVIHECLRVGLLELGDLVAWRNVARINWFAGLLFG